MGRIIFVMVSLLFSLFDYNIGISVTRQVYGEEVSILLTYFPLNVVYFFTVFFVELIMIREYQAFFAKILSILYKRSHSLFYENTKKR